MEQKIKELRLKIDGLAQLTKNLKCNRYNQSKTPEHGWQSSQIGKATDSLFLAKAWLGKVLGSLGTESPYPKDGSRKTVADIEKTADQADLSDYYVEPLDYEHKSHIKRVDWLRQEIAATVQIIVDFGKPENAEIFTSSREIAIARTNCYTYLSEARFWLGFELERIKEEDIA